MAGGAFDIEGEGDTFNLKPKGDVDRIPDDQRELHQIIYNTRNILKLLKEHGAFSRGGNHYDEFVSRVLQAAKVGCTTAHVQTALARSALNQIGEDIMRRSGRRMAFRYFLSLFAWGLGGVALSLLYYFIVRWVVPGIENYGLIVVGSMAGAWFSVAAGRWKISYLEIQEFLEIVYEPSIRLLFAATLGILAGIFLELNLISIKIGNVEFSHFMQDTRIALALGAICGIGEKFLSVQIINRVRQVGGANPV